MSKVEKMLEKYGITNIGNAYLNLTVPELYEHAIRKNEGWITEGGPLLALTGIHTGRSTNDRFIVEDSTTKDVDWGPRNKGISEHQFDVLYGKVLAYMQGKDIFIRECYAGAREEERLKVRVITEFAWHSIFAYNMFIEEKDPAKLENFQEDFTVISLPNLHGVAELDGINSSTFVVVNMSKKIVIVGNSGYAGEIKKSIFSVINYILPRKGILSMHCSANVGKEGDTCLFFGLSGTGKTTLSTDPNRYLIGDDEHAWDDKGIFNIEGGCYAKTINLTEESEPEVYATTHRFGSILENVSMFEGTRDLDFFNDSLTENNRVSYPREFVPLIAEENGGGHPKNIIFLTFDAFGVLPPVAKLENEQILFHFISGYTAKVAGTEKGAPKEPSATFSTCFGGPFMVLSPFTYANILNEKIQKHNTNVYLLNTGLTGGPYGIGKRYSIKDTRSIIKAILEGKVDEGGYNIDPVFGFKIPKAIPGVNPDVLDPSKGWKSKEDYDRAHRELANKFLENFKEYAGHQDAEKIAKGGPKL